MADVRHRMLQLDLPLVNGCRDESGCFRVVAARFGRIDRRELVKPFAGIASESILQPNRDLARRLTRYYLDEYAILSNDRG